MILITGISGFVGKNLQLYLKNKNKIVKGISRYPKINQLNYNEINNNLLNSTNTIIHLAGKAHYLKNTSNDDDYFSVNTDLTKKIFDKFLDSSCKTFIYISSVKAVSDSFDGILTEKVSPNPISPYGKSKLAAENYIMSKKNLLNKKIFILRPCMIHGPNNKGNLNLLYNFVSKGIPFPLGKYKNKRSFVSVENICFVINELIENKNIKSGIYNVADDTSLSINDLVKLISQVLKIPVRIMYFPKSFVNFLARIGDFLPLVLNSEKLKKMTENYEVSNKKIKKVLQKKLPLSSKDGFIKTFKSFSLKNKA